MFCPGLEDLGRTRKIFSEIEEILYGPFSDGPNRVKFLEKILKTRAVQYFDVFLYGPNLLKTI